MNRNWIYNEFKHIGVDYSDSNVTKDYDKEHEDFRDYKQETKDLINLLALKETKDLIALDFGCGTGAFSIHAAQYFKKIFAIDVSSEMLTIAKQKAISDGIKNIEFIQSGFLNYRHNSEPVDLVISKIALHHLPDFWKQIGLININRTLKTGGLFYYFDIVFHFDPTQYLDKINNWIGNFSKKVGADFAQEIETHIRDEFSTFDWITEGMINRAGFKILHSKCEDGFSTEILCKKIKEL